MIAMVKKYNKAFLQKLSKFSYSLVNHHFLSKMISLCFVILLVGCSENTGTNTKQVRSTIFRDIPLITQVHLKNEASLIQDELNPTAFHTKVNGNEANVCVQINAHSICHKYPYQEIDENEYEKPLSELLAAYLEENALDTQVSYFYVNTITQEEIVKDGDRIMLGASTIKVPLVMAYTDMIENGAVSAEQGMLFHEFLYEESENDLNNFYAMNTMVPLEFLMHHAIRYSDNSATNIMQFNFGTYSEMPFRVWYSNFYPMAYENDFYVENQITANLQKEVMKYLYEHQSDYPLIIEDMEFAYPNRYIKASVNDFTVAHKWGYYSVYHHDIAIIDTPQPILVGIFTEYGSIDNGEQIIADMARIMVDYTLAHL